MLIQPISNNKPAFKAGKADTVKAVKTVVTTNLGNMSPEQIGQWLQGYRVLAAKISREGSMSGTLLVTDAFIRRTGGGGGHGVRITC